MARDWMLKAELPVGWAAEIARDHQRRAAKPPSADEIAQEREAVLGRLRKDWGDATDQKLAQVRDLVMRAGHDRLAETLDRSGLGNIEWFVRQLAILVDRSAAKAAEKGKSEGSEGSESNGDTGPVYREIAYRPGEIGHRSNLSVSDGWTAPHVLLMDNSGKGTIGNSVGPRIAPLRGTETASESRSNERTGYSGGGTGGGGGGGYGAPAPQSELPPAYPPGSIENTVGSGIAMFGGAEPNIDLIDILIHKNDEDGLRQRIVGQFGPDLYARTNTPEPPPGIGAGIVANSAGGAMGLSVIGNLIIGLILSVVLRADPDNAGPGVDGIGGALAFGITFLALLFLLPIGAIASAAIAPTV